MSFEEFSSFFASPDSGENASSNPQDYAADGVVQNRETTDPFSSFNQNEGRPRDGEERDDRIQRGRADLYRRQQAGGYDFLNEQDSVIIVCERASLLFDDIKRKDRASQMRGREISSLLSKGQYLKARQCIDEYEAWSELFSSSNTISFGHEIYYYIKGEYYLAIHKIDSAEYMFRKELIPSQNMLILHTP